MRSFPIGLALLALTVACGDEGTAVNDTTAGSTSAGSTSDADPTTAGSTEGTDSQGGTVGGFDCPDPMLATCPDSPGFIGTERLQALLADPSVRILDLRGDADHDAGHVPGAVVFDAGALRATIDDVSGQVASEADARVAFEAAGLSGSEAVVVYGPSNGTDPSRVVWTLAYYGHTGPAWALDGGYDRWVEVGGPVETGPVTPTEVSYATAVQDPLRVDAQWVLDHLDDPSVTLVDARSDDEYALGHIPGAIQVNWTTAIGPDGLFLGGDALKALFQDPAPDQTLVTYCQTGSRGAVDWLLLAHLGYADVRLYDGSWAEWGANPDLPQE